MKLSPFLERRARAIGIIAAAEAPLVERTFHGVRLKGTTNGSQGTTLAGRRARRGAQRGLRSLGQTAARLMRLDRLAATLPLVVRIVRVAPNRLDGDNLEASLKRLRDGVAKAIGIDDRSPAVEYVADDQRGGVREYAVRFEVYPQLEPQAAFAPSLKRGGKTISVSHPAVVAGVVEQASALAELAAAPLPRRQKPLPTPNLVTPRK